jgi:hypothetical protein
MLEARDFDLERISRRSTHARGATPTSMRRDEHRGVTRNHMHLDQLQRAIGLTRKQRSARFRRHCIAFFEAEGTR